MNWVDISFYLALKSAKTPHEGKILRNYCYKGIQILMSFKNCEIDQMSSYLSQKC